MRLWQDWYGDPLVDEVRARVRERDWKRAVRGVLVLLRYHALGLALPRERRIERRKLLRSLQLVNRSSTLINRSLRPVDVDKSSTVADSSFGSWRAPL